MAWKPEVDLEEVLQRTVEWYLTNQDWVESVITGEYLEYYRQLVRSKM
jgi:dTDP-glucose 4,6-dehydratase